MDLPPGRKPQAFEELGWDGAHPELIALIEGKTSGLLSSQVCEDSFNFQKNSGMIRGKRQWKRIEKVMAVPIARRVLSGVHRYEELEVDEAAPCFSAKPARDNFKASEDNASMTLGAIAGVSPTPACYSPQCHMWSQQHADLQMLSDCRGSGDWACLSESWMGALLKGKRKVVFRLANGGDPQQWFVGGHFSPIPRSSPSR